MKAFTFSDIIQRTNKLLTIFWGALVAVVIITGCNTQLAFAHKIPNLTDSELKIYGMKTPNHPKFLLLNFHSPYCGTCQQTQPVILEMEKKLKRDIRFETLDVDDNPLLIKQFKIEGTPTYIIYDDAGKPVYRMSRYISLQILFTHLQQIAGKLPALNIPSELLQTETSVTASTTNAQTNPKELPAKINTENFTLFAIHPKGCEPCKAQTSLLNSMVLASEYLTLITLDPSDSKIANALKKLDWPTKQGYVLLDADKHQLVSIKGNPEPDSFWQNITMLMGNGLDN